MPWVSGSDEANGGMPAGSPRRLSRSRSIDWSGLPGATIRALTIPGSPRCGAMPRAAVAAIAAAKRRSISTEVAPGRRHCAQFVCKYARWRSSNVPLVSIGSGNDGSTAALPSSAVRLELVRRCARRGASQSIIDRGELEAETEPGGRRMAAQTLRLSFN